MAFVEVEKAPTGCLFIDSLSSWKFKAVTRDSVGKDSVLHGEKQILCLVPWDVIVMIVKIAAVQQMINAKVRYLRLGMELECEFAVFVGLREYICRRRCYFSNVSFVVGIVLDIPSSVDSVVNALVLVALVVVVDFCRPSFLSLLFPLFFYVL